LLKLFLEPQNIKFSKCIYISSSFEKKQYFLSKLSFTREVCNHATLPLFWTKSWIVN